MPPMNFSWFQQVEERMEAVGPWCSRPCAGPLPSPSGKPASLPSAEAPVAVPSRSCMIQQNMLGTNRLPCQVRYRAISSVIHSVMRRNSASISGSSFPYLGMPLRMCWRSGSFPAKFSRRIWPNWASVSRFSRYTSWSMA